MDEALLIFHSPTDNIVGIDNARRLYEMARHPKSFVGLDGADHLLSDEADARFVADVLAAWAGRYVHEEGVSASAPTAGAAGDGVDPADRSSSASPEAPDLAGHQVAVAIGAQGYTTSVNAAGHALLADEPTDVGGADRGPTPYGLLLASLGSCIAITLRMYADRKGWPLHGATIRLSHQRIHAQDCAECETRDGRIDHIDQHVTLAGPLDPAQRRRLMEIADKCPVHRTLTSETRIQSHDTEKA